MTRTAIVGLGLAGVLLGGCVTPLPAPPPPPEVAACGAREFNVYYESWQKEPSRQARADIAAFQREFRTCNIDRVRIVGMAGSPGDEQANLQISRERAEAIANVLAAGGWPRTAFEVVAVGEAGAAQGGLETPMRRRAQIAVWASPKAP